MDVYCVCVALVIGKQNKTKQANKERLFLFPFVYYLTPKCFKLFFVIFGTAKTHIHQYLPLSSGSSLLTIMHAIANYFMKTVKQKCSGSTSDYNNHYPIRHTIIG